MRGDMKMVDWGLACGRIYLTVDGFVVAMEGDMCRDENREARCWTGDMIRRIAGEDV